MFTDKTGTLTENDMQFRECSINGLKYVVSKQFGLRVRKPFSYRNINSSQRGGSTCLYGPQGFYGCGICIKRI